MKYLLCLIVIQISRKVIVNNIHSGNSNNISKRTRRNDRIYLQKQTKTLRKNVNEGTVLVCMIKIEDNGKDFRCDGNMKSN